MAGAAPLAGGQHRALGRQQGHPRGRARGVEGEQHRAGGRGSRAHPSRTRAVHLTGEEGGGAGGGAVESMDARLEEMGRKMDRLRSLYESFFMGTERTPPNIPGASSTG